jgi:hypothetical protein
MHGVARGRPVQRLVRRRDRGSRMKAYRRTHQNHTAIAPASPTKHHFMAFGLRGASPIPGGFVGGATRSSLWSAVAPSLNDQESAPGNGCLFLTNHPRPRGGSTMITAAPGSAVGRGSGVRKRSIRTASAASPAWNDLTETDRPSIVLHDPRLRCTAASRKSRFDATETRNGGAIGSGISLRCPRRLTFAHQRCQRARADGTRLRQFEWRVGIRCMRIVRAPPSCDARFIWLPRPLVGLPVEVQRDP